MAATPAMTVLNEHQSSIIAKNLNELGEHKPDTLVARSIITTLFAACKEVTHVAPKFGAFVSIDTPDIVTLTITNVPVISKSMCDDIVKVGSGDKVLEITFTFEDETIHKVLDSGCVKVQYWRERVEHRRTSVYPLPQEMRERHAQPDWASAELGIDGAQFAQDRARIMSVMHLVYNTQSVMPRGITCHVDLIYKTNFYTTAKRKARGASPNRKRAPGRIITDETDRSSFSTHIGYLIVFTSLQTAFPSFGTSFTKYLRLQIGPKLINWFVVFPETRPLRGAPGQVSRRREEFAVTIACSDVADDDVANYSLSGAAWLVRRVHVKPTTHSLTASAPTQ